MKTFITSFLGALLLSCASACAPGPLDFPVDLQIGSEFTPLERDLIVEAVDRWEAAVPQIEINLVERYTFDEPSIIRGRHKGMSAGDAGGTVYTNFALPVVIYVDADLLYKNHGDGQQFRSVFTSATMHELGHWMALEHTNSGVMYWSLCQEMVGLGCARFTLPCVTVADIEEFCSVYNCRGDEIAPECEDVL